MRIYTRMDMGSKWSGTVVKGIVEYRSGAAARICRETPLDIRFTDYPLARGRATALSLLPARTGPGGAREKV